MILFHSQRLGAERKDARFLNFQKINIEEYLFVFSSKFYGFMHYFFFIIIY